MYKDKAKQREAVKKAVDKHRGITKGITPDDIVEGITSEGITKYPAIVYALTDPIKRKKLEKVCQSLKIHNVLKEVRYGVSGPTFDVVGDWLEATQ